MPTIIGCTLPDPYYSTVESIRADLVETFGVDEYANPSPHFTLYPLAEGVDASAVRTALEPVAAEHDPVTVHTDGIGLFPQLPVWLPVAKAPALTDLQSAVVEAVEHLGPPPVPFYEPHRWFPHVGFAVADDPDQAGDIVRFLLEYDLDWAFTVDNITIMQPPADGGQYEIQAAIDL